MKIEKHLASIAASLENISKNIQDMRDEQKYYMELSRKEEANAPDQMMQMFNMIQGMLRGDAPKIGEVKKHGD
jgi:Na+/phosphate symporter